MRSRGALFVCHLIGNALLLWLAYYWLGVNESTNARLIWSVVVALVFVAGAVWLHGMGLAHFSGIPLAEAARQSARHLAPLILLSLLTLVLYGALLWTGNQLARPAYVIGSWLTLHLKKPVSPRGVERFFQIVLDIVQYVVVPVLLLPLARAIAVEGWRGWKATNLRQSRRALYWIEVGVLLFVGISAPFKLFFWIPKIESFGGQFWSFALRVALGYLIFVVALLAVEFFTSAGKPRDIQPSTAVSP
ncbi:MAG TPA: hypothetical protein VKX25_13780 [Bryobacteraceae bacterium]|jgi:hypothetical protein|nr:hypothetical protein [Bryobacteraceae bacterium]